MGYLLIIVVIYIVALVAVCTLYIKVQEKRHPANKDEFSLGGRSLSMPVVGITLALTNLGAIHVFGLMESGFMLGAMSMWFSFGEISFLVVVCLFTGWLVRKYECASMAEFIAYVFGEKMRIIVTCATAGVVWGFMTLEAQGLGIVFEAFTGWDIKIGIAIGATVSVLYVLLGGMKEISYANVINTVIMYVGVVVAVILLAMFFPGGNGWAHVNEYFRSTDQAWMLSTFGDMKFVLTSGVALAIVVVFSQSMNQNSIIVCASAKSAKVVRQSVFITVLLNCCFAPFTIAMGMAAKSLPQFEAMGPKLGATRMLMEALPPWALVILIACFTAAIVSSYAIVALALAASWVKDIYKPRFRPNASEKEEVIIIRIGIVLLAASAAAAGSFLPTILAALGWISSFMAPVFCMFLFGLFWKRSDGAATITVAVAWVVNMLWSFTSLPQVLGIEGEVNAYITIGIGFILGAILTAAMPGKPSFFAMYKGKGLADLRKNETQVLQ